MKSGCVRVKFRGGGGEKVRDSAAIHRATRVDREDFEHPARQGVNAVKIPIGYWLTGSPAPHPFHKDGAHILDKVRLG